MGPQPVGQTREGGVRGARRNRTGRMSQVPAGGIIEEVRMATVACKLVGVDGNIFAVLGAASRALRRAGLPEKVKEMQDRASAARSYDEALAVILEYVHDEGEEA